MFEVGLSHTRAGGCRNFGRGRPKVCATGAQTLGFDCHGTNGKLIDGGRKPVKPLDPFAWNQRRFNALVRLLMW